MVCFIGFRKIIKRRGNRILMKVKDVGERSVVNFSKVWEIRL